MLAKLTNNIEIPYDELWLNDDDLAIYTGKSKQTIQRLLCEMYKDRKYRKYIDKVGGRSTKLKAYDDWRMNQNAEMANRKRK